MAKPVGSPKAPYVKLSWSGSVAIIGKIIASPSATVCAAGWEIVGNRFKVQLNSVVTDIAGRPLSVAVMVTIFITAAVVSRIPEISPLSGSIVNPAGNPKAVKLKTSPSGSLASIGNCTASPIALACNPGLVRIGIRLTSFISQRNATPRDNPGTPVSVAITVVT